MPLCNNSLISDVCRLLKKLFQQGRKERKPRGVLYQSTVERFERLRTNPGKSASRARGWAGEKRVFQQPSKEGHTGIAHRRVILIGNSTVVAKDLPLVGLDQTEQAIDG